MNAGIKDNIGVVLAKHGLTVESEFVPFSKSRNKDEKRPSLNWKVTLLHNGRKILTTDYGAGMGHCPFYKAGKAHHSNPTTWEHERIMQECEKGYAVDVARSDSMVVLSKIKIVPESRDVIYSLMLDSDVLDFDSYEGWAGDFGYDEDSRKGEALYNACMKIALQFRRIGESVIAELREAYQDY